MNTALLSLCLAFAGIAPSALAQGDGGIKFDGNEQKPDSQTDAAPEATRLVYQLEPFADLYFLVRSEAGRNELSGLPAEFNDTIAACKKIQDKLGRGTLNWEPLDQRLLGVKTAAELKKAYEKLGETSAAHGNEPVAIRKEAIAWAESLASVEKLFLEKIWPEREPALQRHMQRIKNQFQPKEATCLAYMLKSLGMDDPHDQVPVYMVQEIPWPGAFTINRTYEEGPGGMCFVSVSREELQGTQLFETILHEVTHALDIRSKSENATANVLAQLRDKLQAAGLRPDDRRFHDIPHTIMFIQAGETIRRHVFPQHTHYGEVSGYYKRTGKIAETELPVWTDYLDGKITREAAVDRIVEALTAKPDEHRP